MKKTITSVVATCFVSVFTLFGITYAATPSLVPGVFSSLTVGSQGSGGVTFFNGTIVNATTDNGLGNPVTFGDDVRIDGRVWRGGASGSGDGQPFIIKDDLEVEGSISMGEKTSYAVVGPAAFVPQNINSSTDVSTAMYVVTSNDSSGDTFYAPLDLPHGSVLKSVDFYLADNSASAATVRVYRTDYTQGDDLTDFSNVVQVGSANSTTQSLNTEKVTLSGLNQLVDNTAHYYTLHAEFPNEDFGLVKAVAEYTTTSIN